MNTPVLFVIFNRKQIALKALSIIATVKPRYIYIFADGSRDERVGEAQLCEETRKAVLDAINWDCEVKTRFLNKNIGCDLAVPSAINWLFEHESEGIILEDDCIADPSFFTFCEQMLERYRNDTRVMHVAGTYLIDPKWKPKDSSYFWSKHPLINGWATWKRAWEHFDPAYPFWEEFERDHRIQDIIPTWLAQKYRMFHWNKIRTSPKMIAWDFTWCYAVLRNNGLCANPNVNLIKNIGYGTDSTHFTLSSNPLAKVPLMRMEEIIHPNHMLPCSQRDLEVLKRVNLYSVRGIMYKIYEKLCHVMSRKAI